jgi:hypothetical protein
VNEYDVAAYTVQSNQQEDHAIVQYLSVMQRDVEGLYRWKASKACRMTFLKAFEAFQR